MAYQREYWFVSISHGRQSPLFFFCAQVVDALFTLYLCGSIKITPFISIFFLLAILLYLSPAVLQYWAGVC